MKTNAMYVVGLLTVLLASMAAAEPVCEPHDLGTLGGNGSEVMDINDRGQIVGKSYLAGLDASGTPDQEWHAFLWEDGALSDLGALPGDTRSEAHAINELGTIVGTSGTHAAVIWQDGIIARLPYAGDEGDQPVPVDINNRGQILGYTCCDTCLLWPDAQTEPIRFTGPNGSCQPNAINDVGTVVGSAAFAPGDYRGFIWRHGVMRAAESFPRVPRDQHEREIYAPVDYGYGELVDINNSGLAIGSVRGVRGGPLVWSPRGGGRLVDTQGAFVLPGAVNDWGIMAFLQSEGDRMNLVLADIRGRRLAIGELGDPLYTDAWIAMNNRFQIAWSALAGPGPANAFTCQVPARALLDLASQ